MQKITKFEYSSFGEVVYYSQLKNGLKVYIIPKEGYVEKSAMLTVNFGSLYSQFTTRGRDYSYPEGTAHFLEHKIFEGENGEDLSLQFTNIGSDVNAFTTFDKTSYYFSTTSNFNESLDLLQKLVFTASFTEASINKEKKIITQEIEMYLDDPDYQAYIGALQNIFPKTNLADDIAGTEDSINRITVEDLQRNYKQFYHPSNMVLLVIGDVSVEDTLSIIAENQEKYKSRKPAKATRLELSYEPINKSQSIGMEIANSKLVVAYRGSKVLEYSLLRKYKIALRLLLAMLLGWTSKTYQEWYSDGKIDDSFDMEIEIHPDFSFVLISLDSNQPIAMSSQIRRKITNFEKSKDINEKHLHLLKKEMYGDFIQSLDSVEHINSQFNMFLTESDNYFDLPDTLEKLTLADIISIGHQFFDKADVSDFTVFPK